MGGATTSDPHKWPDSVKQSRNSHDIIITSQDTLQSVLASVGLTEHMELFQVREREGRRERGREREGERGRERESEGESE